MGTHQQTLTMATLLGAIVLLVCWGLYRRNRSPVSRFAIDDLMLGDDGKASKSAAVMFGSFFLTSWAIVYLTITGRITEGYFCAYLAAWVAPTVTRLIKGPAPATPSSA
jgi:hypothetical protein